MSDQNLLQHVREANSVKFETAFFNYDSGVQIKEDMWSDATGLSEGPDSTWRVTISEIRENGILVSAPRNSCATGHQVGLLVRATKEGTGTEVMLHGRAVIDAFRDAGAARDDVFIEMDDLKKSGFDKFLTLFNQRQSSVAELFFSLKGVVEEDE